jgi:hypothetical protein
MFSTGGVFRLGRDVNDKRMAMRESDHLGVRHGLGPGHGIGTAKLICPLKFRGQIDTAKLKN